MSIFQSVRLENAHLYMMEEGRFFIIVGLENGVISILADESEPVHLHSEVELIYILEGNIDVFVKDLRYKTKAGDIILFNSEELHGWYTKGHSLVCRIYIGYYSLKRSVGKQKIYFDCNSVKRSVTDFSRVQSVLDSILKAYVSDAGYFQVKSLYYSLWELIRTQFLDKEMKESLQDDKVIDEVIHYLNEHYKERLSLADMAERWYMSQSSFSRYFKNKTRKGFTEYVRGIRVEHAKQELVQTNSPITEIAYGNGFANVPVFNKNFKDETGVTPSAFRSRSIREKEKDAENPQVQQLKDYLFRLQVAQKKNPEDSKIQLDVQKYGENREHYIEGLGGIFLTELLEGKTQEHVKLIASELHLSYIKIWNSLDDVMERKHTQSMAYFDFEDVDSVLDFLLDHNLKPYFELPRRKKKIISHIGGEIIQEKEAMNYCSADEWGVMLEAFLQHILERYTLQTVREWKFEIWKDPEQLEDMGAFLELYETTYCIIRQYIPKAKIGACNLNVTSGETELRKMLLFWKKKRMIPDCITIMSYPYTVSRDKDGKYVLYHIEADKHFIKKDVEEYRNLLRELEYPDLPILISEWNTSLSQKNHYNDSCAKACHMLRQMNDLYELGVENYYSDISDNTLLYYDSKGPLIGASGLISKDGLLKPSFYALKFFRKLGSQIIKSDEHYTVTAQGDGSYQILSYNAKEFNENYFVREESQIYVQELSTIFKDKEQLKQRFELLHVKNKKYCIRIFRLKETEGSVLSEWGKLGNGEKLMREEIDYLKKMSVPRMHIVWENVSDNRLEINLTIDPNEMILVMIQ